MVERVDAIADLYQGDVNPDDWVVWVSDVDGEGVTLPLGGYPV